MYGADILDNLIEAASLYKFFEDETAIDTLIHITALFGERLVTYEYVAEGILSYLRELSIVHDDYHYYPSYRYYYSMKGILTDPSKERPFKPLAKVEWEKR